MDNQTIAGRPLAKVLLATTAAWVLTSGAAAAQTADPAGQAETQASSLDEVVVTAQRREERLQDVPIAISTFTAEYLEKAGITTTKDLTQVTPGLNFTQSSYSPQPTIRGIGTRGVAAGEESVVPVYVDGVYQPFLASTVMDLNSVSRIEVLKGPQGALFGRNSTGGAINVITRDPSVDPTADLSVSYGSFNEVEGKAYFSGGIGNFAADLALLGRHDDGYIRNITTNEDVADVNIFNARSKLQWDASNELRLTVIGGHVRAVDSTPYATQPLDRNTVARRFNPSVVIPTDPFETAGTSGNLVVRQTSLSLTAEYATPWFDLTSISAIQDNSLNAAADNDATAEDIGYQNYHNYSDSFIQELYATSTSEGRFSWIAGLTYYDDTSGIDPQITRTRSVTTGVTTVNNLTSSIDTRSLAVYAQGTYEFSDEWSLTVGGRYTDETKQFDFRNNGTGATVAAEADYSVFTPTATLQFQPSRDLNIYARAGRGFKAGVFPATVASTTPADPEYVTQYELGVKANPLPWLRTNVAAFYSDYQDVQVNVRHPVTNLSGLQNAGGAELYGLEGEFFATPVDNLNIRAGLSLLHGEYTEYAGAQISVPNGLGGNSTAYIDAAGKKMIRTPFVTANLGFDYTWDVGGGEVTLAANAYHAGKSYWEAGNRVVQDPYTLVNSELSWSPAGGGYRVSIWGENLTDVVRPLFVLSSATADSLVNARPRTVGVRLSWSYN